MYVPVVQPYLHAVGTRPAREFPSFLLSFLSQVVSYLLMRISVTSWRNAFIRIVSISIPKKVKE